MFVGHFAVALAAKRAAPRTSLATLFAAAQLLDLVWPVLVLAGLETVRIDPGNTAFTPLDFTSYPWSHSALLAAGWAGLFGAAYLLRTGDRAGAAVCAALVASHWLLDVASHRPDLPLYPGGPKEGLGLWGSVPWTLAVELTLFALGLALYLGATRARDAVGRWALVGLIAFLLVAYLGNVAGPPPPSPTAVAVVTLVGWAVILPWAAWADRHREARTGAGGVPAAGA